MSNIYEWSTEAASNANVDNDIKWELGQPAKLTNDSARAMMQRFAEYLVDLAPKLTAAGGANAESIYRIKSCSPIARLHEGMRFYVIPHCGSKGADKLALNNGQAVQIYKFSTVKQEVTALEAGDLVKGNCYELLYSPQLHIENSTISGWFVANLYNELAGQTALSGTILSFGGLKPPAGWLFCDGAMLESAKYPQLYQVIGQNYGGGGGSGKFALPDLRGVFIRGFDAGKGLDIGRIFGSFQDDENKAHQHKLTIEEVGLHAHNRLVEWNEEGKPAKPVHKNFPKMFNDDEGLYRGPSELEITGKHSHQVTMEKQGVSSGMRPKNISINYIIKI